MNASSSQPETAKKSQQCQHRQLDAAAAVACRRLASNPDEESAHDSDVDSVDSDLEQQAMSLASQSSCQPCAQSLSSLATCSTSSRSSACEVAAAASSTEWLQQEVATNPEEPLDKLRNSLHSLRLARGGGGSRGSQPAGGLLGPDAVGGGQDCPARHHQHHQQHQHHSMPSRGGVCSRRRSSAICAKSKAQYLTQYKAAKVCYFKAVIGGQATVIGKLGSRTKGLELDSSWR